MLTTGIRFRGKCKETDVWVYGHLFSDNGKAYIIDTMSEDMQATEYSEVYPETVGQHTRLRDSVGEGIYEGDIVEPLYKKEVVAFNKEYGGFLPFVTDGGCGCCSDLVYVPPTSCRVLGNIHDNPELLGDIKQ